MFGKINFPGNNKSSSVSVPKKNQNKKTKIIQKQPKPFIPKKGKKKNAQLEKSLKGMITFMIGSKFRVLN